MWRPRNKCIARFPDGGIESHALSDARWYSRWKLYDGLKSCECSGCNYLGAVRKYKTSIIDFCL